MVFKYFCKEFVKLKILNSNEIASEDIGLDQETWKASVDLRAAFHGWIRNTFSDDTIVKVDFAKEAMMAYKRDA